MMLLKSTDSYLLTGAVENLCGLCPQDLSRLRISKVAFPIGRLPPQAHDTALPEAEGRSFVLHNTQGYCGPEGYTR